MASPYSSVSSATGGAPHSPSVASSSTASHREVYENERTRIQQSCFSRADADGQLLECYITHVRVIEDAVHPSAPPPPDYHPGPDARKNRVIIVAVRKSGRVRLHKARENNTGSFSIGKSWYLDDLTRIENDPGCTGFTATIGKPYYWQTRTSREKEAFVASLFRIFKKYTGGKTPTLIGFESITSSEGRPSTATSDIFLGDSLNGQRQSPAPTPPGTLSAASRPKLSVDPESRPHSQSSDLSINPRTQRRPTNESTRTPLSPAVFEPKSAYPDTDQPASQAEKLVEDNGLIMDPTTRQRKQIPPGGDGGVLPTAPKARNGLPTSPKGIKSDPITSGPPPTIPQQASGEQSISVQTASYPANLKLTQTQGPPPTPSTPSTPLTAFPQLQKVATKSSTKDIAAKFRLAADAYAAGGALSKAANRNRGLLNPTLANALASAPSVASPSFAPERAAIRDLKTGNGDAAKVGVTISKEDLLRGKMGPSLQDSLPEKSPRRPESPALQNLPESIKAPTMNSTDIGERAPSALDNRPIPSIDISQTPDSSASKPERSRDATPSESRNMLSDPQNGAEGKPPVQGDEKTFSKTSLLSVRHKRPRSTAATLARTRYMSQIDLSSLTVDIDAVLDEFGWDGRTMKIDDLEAEVRQELAKVESGNIWMATDDENKAANNTRIDELARRLDETLVQCDELDGLLTLYAVELMSLQDDIAYIENQSQGLQVQTANQKILQKELELLLQTVSISPDEISTLQNAKVTSENLPDIESSLCVLYKAIITIDPSVINTASSKPGSVDGEPDDTVAEEAGMGKMMALKDKKDKYVEDSKMFCRRLMAYMTIKYRQDLMTLVKPADASSASRSNMKSPIIGRPKTLSHMAAYQSLYKFAGLILFARDIDRSSYLALLKEYSSAVKEQFTEEIRGNILGWKGIIRRPTAEDQEILFTHTEKEIETTSSVKSLGAGVMRSATRAKPFRSQSSESTPKSTPDKVQDGKIPGSDGFSGFLDDIIPLVAAEQNFLSEFFHMSSNHHQSFLEFVQSGHPDDRQPSDLNIRRVPEQDKQVGKKIYETMAEVFGFLGTEMQNFVAGITANDPLQGVGVIYAVEKKLGLFREGTNQEFLVKALLKMNEQLKSSFINFLKEQVRAIEATKVKAKKKRAVLDFIKSFPAFSAKIEDQLPPEQLTNEILEVREMVNNGYSILNRAMFDALQTIAKQASSAGGAQSADPDDKEALNYHITIIQNMDYYTEALEIRNNSILQDSKQKAEEEYREHLGAYVGAVIRKYLEKTLDFVEGVEALEQTATPPEILAKKNFTKLKFKEILNDNQKEISGSNVKDGIKALVKRVTKQFGDEGSLDPLSIRVLKEAENQYLKLVNRINSLLQGTYRDQGLEMPLKREDVTAAFAKQMSAK
ncbi:hypothetical protein TWF694_008621 [Orbilia ellipsospora]|uniref:Exocyst complex component Sec3 PIP2-binding N-terminal domain-containing protein n=1 Tax=Orbilia ellipsospora TaxID=2528407 RepID=A0AAV9XGN4_9PEZI